MRRLLMGTLLSDTGVPDFPRCHATKRNAGIKRGRPPFNRGDLWTLGCYLKAGYRDNLATFGIDRDMDRLLRKLTYFYRHGMPAL